MVFKFVLWVAVLADRTGGTLPLKIQQQDKDIKSSSSQNTDYMLLYINSNSDQLCESNQKSHSGSPC